MIVNKMVYGQNWVLFSDKPPLSNVVGRSVPVMDFNIVVAHKVGSTLVYSIMSAKTATEQYFNGFHEYHAWKFFEPCEI